MSKEASFRFYAELNDFLPKEHQFSSFRHSFQGSPSIKDRIESLGVPHTEIDLILVNGKSVDFQYHLQDADTVSVYPVFESLDISPVLKLRPGPLREPRFILDVNLGKLTRKLRMLGFDSLYRDEYTDSNLIAISLKDRRILLTRNRGLLKKKTVTHGTWIRSTDTPDQLREVLERFDLFSGIDPFVRCMECNGTIEPVDKKTIQNRLLPKTAIYYDEFYCCQQCQKIYWKGSHYRKMMTEVQEILLWRGAEDST